jgi:hypothetical protein
MIDNPYPFFLKYRPPSSSGKYIRTDSASHKLMSDEGFISADFIIAAGSFSIQD